MKTSNNESIFLWDLPRRYLTHHGLLAGSIKTFGHHAAGQYGAEQWFSKIRSLARPPYLMTNQGLQFHIPQDLAQKQEILLPLYCQYRGKHGVIESAYAIRLERISCEGRWARMFEENGSDCLPELGSAVRSAPESSDLFLVPVGWAWNRKELVKRGSEIIYVMADKYRFKFYTLPVD